MNHLHFEPLRAEHLKELAHVLLHPDVYEHIEPEVPSIEDFTIGLERAIAGPQVSGIDERWLNFLVRESSGLMVGRLEATVHHDLVEVAFLFGSQYWGRGFASAGLQWLHNELANATGITDFLATTTHENLRSQKLLQRCGYKSANLPASPLYSYELGDLIFHYKYIAD